MTYQEFKDKLCSFDPSKECFCFLAERIGDDNYRGIQCSQHNRYDVDVVFTILDELHNAAGEEKMIIRTADLKKRPRNLPEEAAYAKYVSTLCNKLGRCTQDSVRKNLFVDLHRMGLLERFNSTGKMLDPYENGTKKYVRISKQGLDFIDKGHTLFERKLRYTRAIDTLTRGLADELLCIVDLGNTISETEFQFFFSFCGETMNGHRYSVEELLDYIKEFRSLSRYQREGAIDLVKEYCDPDTFAGDKTEKRDYHNWLNETQQIFMLMGQTAYYEVCGDVLQIRVGKDALYKDTSKLKRSQEEKERYFKQHGISRTKGFELHHMVPLCWAKSALEFSTLDVWQNLIYIDGYKHSIITQNRNEHVNISFEEDEMVFRNFKGDEVRCKIGENVLFAADKQDVILDYNRQLLHSCGAATT